MPHNSWLNALRLSSLRQWQSHSQLVEQTGAGMLQKVEQKFKRKEKECMNERGAISFQQSVIRNL
jgi:hypothetical protein